MPDDDSTGPARGASQRETVTVDGHRVTLTNLSKVIYPETGTTKADVLAYLAAVAQPFVAHTTGRPATRKRWVHGTGGPVFFQKNLDDSAPDWVHRRDIQHSDHVNTYPLVDDLATLTWLGQVAALEIHVPQWRFGRTGVEHRPDRLVLDLDPGPGTGLDECVQVALWAREILTGMDLDPFPVTSGSKGIHLYAALDGAHDSDAVSAVAHELARALQADHPDLVVSDMKKSLREGKVLVDWSQNNRNKTTISPYSLRGRDRPYVAAPRSWAELEAGGLQHLEADEVVARLERDGDLLAPLLSGGHAALEPTAARMAGFERTDRLEVYRSRRDASKTPEPVPEAPSAGAGTDSAGSEPSAPTFVIQEHHARALHFDFRLEHDGVLVSWALPKGEPVDTTHNRLGVQTEDHPLEYGSFEGTIPKGEYGAGTVTVWDRGTYDLHKWREGEEVIVTLHSDGSGGTDRGSRRIALIHTAHSGGGNSWLVHRMADEGGGQHGSAARRRGRSAGSSEDAGHAGPDPDDPAGTTGGPGGGTSAGGKPLTPMLATPGTVEDLDEDDWAFEMKWDGIRAIATVVADRDGAPGSVRLTSRNGNDLTASYPELGVLSSCVDEDVVLDGEIVALDRAGRPDFGRLQTRMNLTARRDVAVAQKAQGVDYMAFDLVERAGRRLTRVGYDGRREALEEVVSESGPVHVPPAFTSDAATALAASEELGLEGIVAKRRSSTYRPGRPAHTWVKVKHVQTQEVVVVGWRTGNGARAETLGSLLVAVPDDSGVLRYAGRVGTGFTDATLERLSEELARHPRATPPVDDVPAADARDAHWVRADRVGEVAIGGWTAQGRLRHPVWRGWRTDKSPSDVVREDA